MSTSTTETKGSPYSLQELKMMGIRDEAQQMDERMKYGPQITYNPIEETVGPDGKKTIGLRKEFQLEGPEAYLTAERARLSQEQAQSSDQLKKTQLQQEAQQRSTLASRGGFRGSNPALAGRYSMRDALLGEQKLSAQKAAQNYELESKGQALAQDIKAKNLANLMGETKRLDEFNLDKYKSIQEQMAAKEMAAAYRNQPRGK